MGAEKILADVMHGEAANKPYSVKKMIGSTVFNRLNSGRAEEFGDTYKSVIQKGYYAASMGNEPYKQAVSGKFPDKKSEDSYKESLSIASGLIRGTIEPDKGMFYFTEKEIKKLKKNPKAFDFEKVKPVGTNDIYQVFSY